MKKNIIYHHHALKELDTFGRSVGKRFEYYIEILEEQGRLAFPEARKVTRDIFEIRVVHEGAYRGFYAYLGHPDIVILHFFQKKTQRTPLKHIQLTERRLQDYA